MKTLKVISDAISENIIPIILGCIIFPFVYWMANNVDNPKANPYASGGTLNPIVKTDSIKKSPGKSSFARSTRNSTTNMSSSSLLLDL